MLVRPDRHVAGRAEDMAGDPAAQLTRVMETILGRRAGAADLAAR